MKIYSVDYWLHHYEYVMGHKEKNDLDTSNAKWTKSNIENILINNFPHGATGTNIVKALIEYIKIYHPDNKADVIKLMLEYIVSLQSKERPLKKVHDFLLSINNESKS